MTNEERGAIYRLSVHSKYAVLSNKTAAVNKVDLDTVLSLIKAQQEEISKYKTLYERALSDVVKADKIIDLMADYIGKEDITEIFCDGKIGCDENCKTCVKQYFERQVNSSKQ